MSRIVLAFAILAASLSASPTLRAQFRFKSTSYPLGVCPASIEAGDLDRDGRLDLVVANHHSHEIWVYLGDGKGAFTAKDPTPAPGKHESHTLTLGLADFNADGILDVATASFSNDRVLVFPGAEQGELLEASSIEVGAYSLRLDVGDFNGDRIADIAVANRDDQTISVLLCDGLGGFATPVHYPVEGGPTAVAAADLDGDQILDLATSNSVGATVTFLKGRGDGSFQEIGTLGGFDGVRFVLVEDLDADGHADMAVANGTRLDICPGNGRYGFRIAQILELGSSSFALAGADFDGDGIIDLAATRWDLDDVVLLKGDGQARYPSLQEFKTGRAAWGVTAADFDQDGHPDLAVTNELANTMTVFLNRASTPVRFRRGDANADGLVDLSDAVRVLNYLFVSGPEPSCPAAFDINADRLTNIADPIYLLQFLFNGGPPPPLPFPDCGPLAPDDAFGCSEDTPGCEASAGG
jgi:hypothetical protein